VAERAFGIKRGYDGSGGTDSPDGVASRWIVCLPLLSFPAPQNPEDGEQ